MSRTARLLVASVLLLAGCSDAPSSGASKDAVGGVDKAGSAAGSATDGEAGATGGAAPAGERGNQVATLGEPVTVVDEAGAELIQLTIESITPDYACDADEATVMDPANGHFVALELVVTAGSGLAEFENPYGVFTLTNNGRFTIISSDGVTETNTIVGGSEAYLCTTGYNEVLTLIVEPGQTYRGVAVLDTANASGTLIWQPVLEGAAPGPGWEWTY